MTAKHWKMCTPNAATGFTNDHKPRMGNVVSAARNIQHIVTETTPIATKASTLNGAMLIGRGQSHHVFRGDRGPNVVYANPLCISTLRLPSTILTGGMTDRLWLQSGISRSLAWCHNGATKLRSVCRKSGRAGWAELQHHHSGMRTVSSAVYRPRPVVC